MSEDQKLEGKERRTIFQTLFDPKTFPTLIPVLLAIGSAFITIDRMVHRISITQEQHTIQITRQQDRIAEFHTLLANVSVLESQLKAAVDDADEQERLQEEIDDIVGEIKHATTNARRELDNIKGRLRDIERDVDRLKK